MKMLEKASPTDGKACSCPLVSSPGTGHLFRSRCEQVDRHTGGWTSTPALLRVAEGPLHIARPAKGRVPGEVGVAKDVRAGPQLGDAPRDKVAAGRLGQVWDEEHALLWEQRLR